MSILRTQPGCSEVPVHMIGGLAGKSTAPEMAKFSIATSETGCVGASAYDWVGMNSAKWAALGAPWTGPSQ